jgi:hypothetical protein
MEMLRRFSAEKQLSMELTYRIHRFVLQNRKTQRASLHIHGMEILKALPNGLKVRMYGESFIPLMKAHPLFFHLFEHDGDNLQVVAFHGIKEQTLLVEHELFCSGQEAKHMYFFIHGQLHYYPEGSLSTTNVVEDKYFCEVALWMTWYHSGKAISSRPTELACLSSDSFRHQAFKFHHHTRLEEYARLYWDLILDSYVDHKNDGSPKISRPPDISMFFDQSQEFSHKAFEGVDVDEPIEQSPRLFSGILKRSKSLGRISIRGR